MEMVYAALLLHSLGKKVDEEGVKKVLQAAGAKAEPAQIKALVSSLKDVNIDEAIKQSTAVQQAAAPASGREAKEKKEEEKAEEKTEKKAEEAAAGLGALFG